MQTAFLQYYPMLLGGVFLVVAIYNLFRDQHVQRRMRQHGLPAWLRWPALIAEVILAIALLFYRDPLLDSTSMLFGSLFLASSFFVCLYTGWYRRMWLSGPLLLCCLLWFWLGSA